MVSVRGNSPKRVLLLEGGAMRAGFVAGAVMALMDNHIIEFDRALAVSASIPTLAYYLTGQRQELEAVWRHELCTPRLVRYRNFAACSLTLSCKRPLLDIDYLVYDIFKKKYPLDAQRLLEIKTETYFAVTRAPEGCIDFLGLDEEDIYEVFKACLAVPGLYPETVKLRNGEFVDGGTVNPLPARVLFRDQDVKILAVLTRPLDCESEPLNVLERALFWRYFHRHEWMVEKLWESAQAHGEEIAWLEGRASHNPPRAFIISPDRMPPARFITRDRGKINSTINMGYRSVSLLLEDIRSFIQG